MKIIKAIIFDLDGVLISTDKLHYTAWKAIANKIGAEFNETINSKLRGVSRMDSLSIILDNSGIELSKLEIQELAEEKNNLYNSL